MLTKKQFTQRVAENLRKARTKKGLSQEQLAHDSSLYRTYINHIETAKYSPSGYVLYKLSKALGVKIENLIPS